ncbi:MAG: hypothetical protein GF331_05455 [Chitinivibrionales bacterium]|nr:hypothetical protein [Chitinivibrionales bacterium]
MGSLGTDRCFGAVKGKVAGGPMTFSRVSTDDTNGIVRAYVGEGMFTDDAYRMDGGIAVCRIHDLQSLLRFMCNEGFEHHTGMCRTHCADAIEEAYTTYMGWQTYRHR